MPCAWGVSFDNASVEHVLHRWLDGQNDQVAYQFLAAFMVEAWTKLHSSDGGGPTDPFGWAVVHSTSDAWLHVPSFSNICAHPPIR